MAHRAWKKELRQAFEPPAPRRKKEFLNTCQNLRRPRISIWKFVFSQIGYIHKRVFLVSIFIFILSLAGTSLFPVHILWTVSALMPLSALIFLAEGGRSEYYQMTELEMATCFSLRSVILARLTILGTGNLLLLGLLLPLVVQSSRFSCLQAGLYIAAPFLLTTCTGLQIVRRIRRPEALSLCAGISVFISFSVLFSHIRFPQIYKAEQLIWWMAAALLLCAGTAKQYAIIINETEDLTWNL